MKQCKKFSSKGNINQSCKLLDISASHSDNYVNGTNGEKLIPEAQNRPKDTEMIPKVQNRPLKHEINISIRDSANRHKKDTYSIKWSLKPIFNNNEAMQHTFIHFIFYFE